MFDYKNIAEAAEKLRQELSDLVPDSDSGNVVDPRHKGFLDWTKEKAKIDEQSKNAEHLRKRENRLTLFIMVLIATLFVTSLSFTVTLPIMYINDMISRESIEFLVERFPIFNWGTIIATFVPLVINFVKQKFDIKIYSKDDTKK